MIVDEECSKIYLLHNSSITNALTLINIESHLDCFKELKSKSILDIISSALGSRKNSLSLLITALPSKGINTVALSLFNFT